MLKGEVVRCSRTRYLAERRLWGKDDVSRAGQDSSPIARSTVSKSTS